MNDTESSLELFAHWLIKQGKSKSTVQTYISVLEKFKKWLKSIGEISLQHLKPVHIQSYMNHLEKKQKSAGTIDKNYAAISVYSKFLRKPNLMLDVTRNTKNKVIKLPDSLKKTEKISLLNSIEFDKNLRNIAIVYTLLQTGVRVSELCALNHSDLEINGEKGKLSIRNEQGKIDRSIPLSKEVRKHLLNYLNSLNSKKHEEAVFISSMKKRITPRSVQYMLKKYNVNPHKLRHTFCQELVNSGVDIRIVAKLAGHRDINITKRYFKNIETDLIEAIDKTFI